MYVIQPRTKKNARQLGLQIFPSDNPKYKLDVYDYRGQFLFRVGASSYSDYPTYIKTHGKKFADNRRRLYMLRHHKELVNENTKGYIAWRLLWN